MFPFILAIIAYAAGFYDGCLIENIEMINIVYFNLDLRKIFTYSN